MPNPYYVEPGTNFLPGLQGLQQGLQVGQEKSRQEAVRRGALMTFRSGDPQNIAEYAIRNPEISQTLMQQMGFKSNQTKENWRMSVRSVIADPSPENVARMEKARTSFLKATGQTEADFPYTAGFMEKYEENPTQALQELEMTYAGVFPGEYLAYRKALTEGAETTKPAKTAMEAFLKQNPDATPEEISEFTKAQAKAEAAGKAEGEPPKQEAAVEPSSDLKDFEMVTYGHLVPELRGTAKYKDDRLSYLKSERDVTTSPNKTEPAVLRKEFIAQSKDFVKVRDSYNRIKASAINPSPAGDLAMIFNYMKVLDPGSVVRESEFATAAQTGAYGERIKAAVSRVLNGQRLSDEMRKDFENRAKELYLEQEKTHNKLTEEYDRLSRELGVEPSNVLINYISEQVKIDNEDYELGEIYRGQDGTMRRYGGKDANGKHIWTLEE